MRVVPALLLAGLALGCAANKGVPPAGGSVVSGTVTYRERMALPPDAVVRVQLSDVSRQDAVAQVIAETTFEPAGRQVPLPFELPYDQAQIDSSHTYAVRATIESGGRLMFTTTSVASVLTLGRPAHADLTLTLVQDRTEALPASLWGTSWLLEDLGGAGVLDDARATLEFPEPGRVAGSGSCNRFFGTAEVAGDSLAISRLGSTRMACAEAVATQETRYLEALQGAQRYTLDGSRLLIYTRGMVPPLRFTRAEP